MGLASFNKARKLEAERNKLKKEISYEGLTFAELKKFAKSKDINTYKMKQEDLIKALEEVGV